VKSSDGRLRSDTEVGRKERQKRFHKVKAEAIILSHTATVFASCQKVRIVLHEA
jgi:hypothetical protein